MDEYKKSVAKSREWGRKTLKRLSRTQGRAILKTALQRTPREPEVHPAETEEIEFRAGCKERGLCSFCGDKLPCGGCL